MREGDLSSALSSIHRVASKLFTITLAGDYKCLGHHLLLADTSAGSWIKSGGWWRPRPSSLRCRSPKLCGLTRCDTLPSCPYKFITFWFFLKQSLFSSRLLIIAVNSRDMSSCFYTCMTNMM